MGSSPWLGRQEPTSHRRAHSLAWPTTVMESRSLTRQVLFLTCVTPRVHFTTMVNLVTIFLTRFTFSSRRHRIFPVTSMNRRWGGRATARQGSPESVCWAPSARATKTESSTDGQAGGVCRLFLPPRGTIQI